MRVFLLLLMLLPALASSPVRTVEIKVYPPDGGMAFCRYEADGKVHGGHASSPPVRVYEEDGKLDPAIVERIWTLAGEVQSQGNSSNSIVITLADGTTRVASWGWKEQPSDPKLRELAELLMEHHVGGW